VVLYRRLPWLQSVAVSTSDQFITSFRTCKTIDGRSETVPVAKRGGHAVVVLSPIWADGGPKSELSSPWLDDPRFYVNLNPIERRTWRRILSGASIAAIGAEEGVTRATIYTRIQGNSFGHGGMIGKNFWVLLWWHLRQGMTAGAR
jgi:hypothetical protein